MPVRGLECRDVHGRIRSGATVASDADVGAHVGDCPACAELLATHAHLGHALAESEASLEPELELDAMLGQLDAELARPVGFVERLRQASTPARSLALFGAAAALLGLAVTVFVVVVAALPLPRLVATIGALVLAIVMAGFVVLRPMHRRPLARESFAALVSFAVLVPLGIALLPTPAGWVEPPDTRGFVEHIGVCFGIGMSFSLALVGAAWVFERSGLRRRGAGTLALVGAGALGNLVLVLVCSDLRAAHALPGHAAISLVLLAVAGVLGLRWSR